MVWTVTPIGGLVNPWSGSETLTITGQNYVFTGQLTNPNRGCEVQVTESGQGQYIAPVGQNPPVSFSFPPQVAIVANETFCPSQSRGDISNYPGSTFPVTILATPIAGGYSLSTTTAYPPNTYEGNSQVTVTATEFLSASGFTCPAGSNVDVTLPSISVTPSLSIKPWQITYAPLALAFAVTQSGSSCVAKSNVGTLGVFFSGTHIADSIASAQLTAFQPNSTPQVQSCQFSLFSGVTNNCLLNGPFVQGASYAQWATSGFSTVPFPTYQKLVPGPGTGRLTFWINLDALGLVPATSSMSSIIQTAEPYIHGTLGRVNTI